MSKPTGPVRGILRIGLFLTALFAADSILASANGLTILTLIIVGIVAVADLGWEAEKKLKSDIEQLRDDLDNLQSEVEDLQSTLAEHFPDREVGEF